MPELPEVETIVRELRERILNKGIVNAYLYRPGMVKHSAVDISRYDDFFNRRTVRTVGRAGKYLLFTLDDGKTLVAHLGMTGKFVVTGCGSEPPKHLCSRYDFINGMRLDHIDARRFGRLELYNPGDEIPILSKLGPDPLSDGFGQDSIRKAIASRNGEPRKQAIHTLLLNQALISGVGNIYAAEALFRAGIRPTRRAGSLKKRECRLLAEHLPGVMQEALRWGGTTVDDYRRIDDKPGSFSQMLQVYDREKQPCTVCGAEINRITLGGRSAYYCKKCQK